MVQVSRRALLRSAGVGTGAGFIALLGGAAVPALAAPTEIDLASVRLICSSKRLMINWYTRWLNTPKALAVMHEWASNGQQELLTEALEVFGLKSLSEPEPPPEEMVALAEARRAARDADDFEEADRLRAEITAAGWEMRDRIGGYVLRPKRT